MLSSQWKHRSLKYFFYRSLEYFFNDLLNIGNDKTDITQDGYCDVALTSNTFDMGTGDNLSFGNNLQSGTTFGDSGSLTWNFTGPYVATACSDSDNTAMNAGYDISYLLLPC